MTIFLTLLKIIGWILLIALLLILLLLILLLFVPVTYQAVGSIHDQKVAGRARASWLFRLVNFHIRYEKNDMKMYLRLFGFRKWLMKSEEEDETKYDVSEAEKENSVNDDISKVETYNSAEDNTSELRTSSRQDLQRTNDSGEDGKSETKADDFGVDDMSEQRISSQNDSLEINHSEENSTSENTGSGEDNSVETDSAGRKNSTLTDKADKSDKPKDDNEISAEDESDSPKMDTIVQKIRRKWKSMTGKIKNIKKRIRKISRMLKDPVNKDAFSHIKRAVTGLLKCIMPSKLKLNVSYSTGSPDTTAQIFGILAMFPIGYTNRWNINPDFEAEEAYADGDMNIKGHFFIVQILILLLGVLFDKKCRRLYHKLKK
jgi:hypothetical protein